MQPKELRKILKGLLDKYPKYPRETAGNYFSMFYSHMYEILKNLSLPTTSFLPFFSDLVGSNVRCDGTSFVSVNGTVVYGPKWMRFRKELDL